MDRNATYNMIGETASYPVAEVRKADDPTRTEIVDNQTRRGLVFNAHLDGFHGKRVLRYEADIVEGDELDADLDTGHLVFAPRKKRARRGRRKPLRRGRVGVVTIRDPIDEAGVRYLVVLIERAST